MGDGDEDDDPVSKVGCAKVCASMPARVPVRGQADPKAHSTRFWVRCCVMATDQVHETLALCLADSNRDWRKCQAHVAALKACMRAGHGPPRGDRGGGAPVAAQGQAPVTPAPARPTGGR